MLLRPILLILALLIPAAAQAQIEHQLVRRLAMFPFKAETQYSAAAEEAWWQAREELTQSRRFLVASKQFLVKSDVFQARAELEPADTIILGKLLDAHALITFRQSERKLTMRVFDGSNGLPLWTKTVNLHPSLTIQDQLPPLSRRMVNDFMANIPYQGFTIVDPLVGQPVFEEGDVKLVQVDLGGATGAKIGDSVQWIRIESKNTMSLFQGGAKVTAFAEGKILRMEQGTATVEVVRATALKDIKEFSLVRIPREAERLVSEFSLLETPRTSVTPELVSPEASPMEQIAKERRPVVATLSWVGSLAAFLLLAF